MSQHPMTIANQAGAAFRGDLNNQTAAIVTLSSGATAPSTTYAYMWWADTTTGLLKQRNGANSAWITVGPLADLGIQSGAQILGTIGGTADAITGAFNPPINTALPGATVWLRSTATNATTTPTLKPDGAPLKTIVKPGGGALAAGDIVIGWNAYQYDTTLDKYVLLNPASGIGSSSQQILSLPNPTLAASAMTLPAATLSLQFRSATASDGVVPATISGTAAALVIPSGATLGAANAVQSSIIEVVMNNSGTLERAVVNLAGGNDLSETGFISTTAIGAGSTAANVFYSNTARSNLPYRVVRRIDSTQATAGAWVTSPSLIQGVGGQALTAMSSLGYGQTWQNVAGSRASGTTYYNTTGKPITLLLRNNGLGDILPTVNGVAVSAGGVMLYVSGTLIVPAGASYSISFPGSIAAWFELR